MTLKQLTAKTIAISKKFPRQWDKKTRFVDLVEEIGEIANALLVEDRQKPKRVLHPGNSLADSLSDTLYDLLILAHQYGINLEKEYSAMLERLEKRIEGGEFNS